MQPLGALLLVKLPTGKLISTAIFLWGVTMCGMAACNSFKTLLATRFLLGSFESLIGTLHWWRCLEVDTDMYRSLACRCDPDVVATQRADK